MPSSNTTLSTTPTSSPPATSLPSSRDAGASENAAEGAAQTDASAGASAGRVPAGRYDVVLIGGGLAGLTLARQLVRTIPGIRVACYERTRDTSYKVGESLVEIATSYLVRRLGLAPYLYEQHLPKNGLRFFFDDAARSLPIERMGEIGTVGLPFHPSFQIDRARIERDLRLMNERDGVVFREGVRVSGVEVGAGGALHRVTVSSEAGEEQVEARWLIDASGRARVLSKAMGATRIESGHPIASTWGRFKHVRDLDELGGPEFRARARHTSRFLSTTHFCYDGYWIWFIPLGFGVTSVGVVGQKHEVTPEVRRTGGRDFYPRHRVVRELLEGAELVDHMSYEQLAYKTTRYFSADRLGLTGEAAAFSDPFYSPGSDFIALANDFLTDLVARDLGGEPEALWKARLSRYDAFMLFRLESTLAVYRDLYPLLGSRDLMRLRWDLDISLYYHVWYHAYALDRHFDLDWIEGQLEKQEFALRSQANFAAFFNKLRGRLIERGTYHLGPDGAPREGQLVEALGTLDDVAKVGLPRPEKEVLRATQATFNRVRERGLLLLAAGSDAPAGTRVGEAYQPWPLYDFLLERDLASGTR